MADAQNTFYWYEHAPVRTADHYNSEVFLFFIYYHNYNNNNSFFNNYVTGEWIKFVFQKLTMTPYWINKENKYCQFFSTYLFNFTIFLNNSVVRL